MPKTDQPSLIDVMDPRGIPSMFGGTIAAANSPALARKVEGMATRKQPEYTHGTTDLSADESLAGTRRPAGPVSGPTDRLGAHTPQEPDVEDLASMDSYAPPLAPDRFDTESIPVVPAAVGYLLSVLYTDDASIKSMAGEVGRFPSIAARLLAVANSAWSAPLTTVTDLPDACTRLGLRLVRTLSIALAVADTFDPDKCPGFDGERYWVTALLAADGATDLATRMGQETAAPSWRCGALFHNIGLLWLADRHPEETNAVLQVRGGEDLAVRMQRKLGTDIGQAGARLARAWGLPDIHTDIIAHYADPDAAGEHAVAAATVGTAAMLASCVYRGETFTPEGMPTPLQAHVPLELAEATWHVLENMLEVTREMGRSIANA